MDEMIQLKECRLQWDQNDQLISVDKKTFLDDCYIDFQKISEEAGTRFLLQIHPKQSLRFNSVKCTFSFDFSPNDKVFCNGFQSWSSSKLISSDEVLNKRKNSIPPNFLEGGKTNEAHNTSWTFGYIQGSELNTLIGSLDESTGFTMLHYNLKTGVIEVTIDCEGLQMEHSFPILDIWVEEGENFQVLLANYFSKFPKKEFENQLYYSGSDRESDIIATIATIQKNDIPFDAMLLPPGSHAKIGDWLSPDSEKFPNGFSTAVKHIKSAHLKPAIWIAPLICSEDSAVFQNHPNWLLKDKTGKPLKLKTDHRWGSIYALNFKQLKVQEYLIGVIHTLTEKWGFECIYADYLFVACLARQEQQTDGQLMNEWVEFLHTQIGEKTLITGGVPLGSSLTQINYTEVGNITFEQKKNPWWNFFGQKIYEGMRFDLSNFFERQHLNQLAFGSVLNLFSEPERLASLSYQQKLSIVRAQALLGSICIASLPLDQASRPYLDGLSETAKLLHAKVQKTICLGKGLFEVQFEAKGKSGIAWFNFTDAERRFTKDTSSAEIKPYESFVFEL